MPCASSRDLRAVNPALGAELPQLTHSLHWALLPGPLWAVPTHIKPALALPPPAAAVAELPLPCVLHSLNTFQFDKQQQIPEAVSDALCCCVPRCAQCLQGRCHLAAIQHRGCSRSVPASPALSQQHLGIPGQA